MTIESEREDERVAPIARPALTDGMGPSRASHLQREGQKPLRLLRRDWSRVEHTARVVICQLDECAPRRRIMGANLRRAYLPPPGRYQRIRRPRSKHAPVCDTSSRERAALADVYARSCSAQVGRVDVRVGSWRVECAASWECDVG